MDLYYEACSVLLKEEDFYDLMYAYLKRASTNHVFVAEIFFDPQTHTSRGVEFSTFFSGFQRALVDGYQNFAIRGSLIMCFLRHLTEEDAMKTLTEAEPFLDNIIAVGLDSGELGNPPKKFENVYRKARELGLKAVAHAGEEAGSEYIIEALDCLHVKRIDHGVQCLKDPDLVKRLVTERIPLTTCPLSNLKLQIYSRYFDGKSVTKKLLDAGLNVTINSDDPAYFGGYITDNFLAAAEEDGLTMNDVNAMCCNAFKASFASHIDKEFYLQEIKQYNVKMGCAVPRRLITIFGSRSPDSPHYKDTMDAGKLFASRGFGVRTGGYSGIMEAGLKGAVAGSSSSVGCSDDVIGENLGGFTQGVVAPRVFANRMPLGNDYIKEVLISRTLTDRIHRMLHGSDYFLVMGGNIGTITELFVLLNTAIVHPNWGALPQKILAWKNPWEKTLNELVKNVAIDLSMVSYVESADEVVSIVEKDLQDRAKTAVM